jgi:hypothetical protein
MRVGRGEGNIAGAFTVRKSCGYQPVDVDGVRKKRCFLHSASL